MLINEAMILLMVVTWLCYPIRGHYSQRCKAFPLPHNHPGCHADAGVICVCRMKCRSFVPQDDRLRGNADKRSDDSVDGCNMVMLSNTRPLLTTLQSLSSPAQPPGLSC